MRTSHAIALVVLSAACSYPPIQLSPGAAKIQVGRSDPPDNYELIGPITGQDGAGCGAMGGLGTYDRAFSRLRNQAASMGADYVAITTITEPHLASPGCFSNLFVINGMAYRKVAEAPSPIPVQTSPPSAGDNANLVEQLKQLKDLHAAGALSDEEFERAKARLLE